MDGRGREERIEKERGVGSTTTEKNKVLDVVLRRERKQEAGQEVYLILTSTSCLLAADLLLGKTKVKIDDPICTMD